MVMGLTFMWQQIDQPLFCNFLNPTKDRRRSSVFGSHKFNIFLIKLLIISYQVTRSREQVPLTSCVSILFICPCRQEHHCRKESDSIFLRHKFFRLFVVDFDILAKDIERTSLTTFKPLFEIVVEQKSFLESQL